MIYLFNNLALTIFACSIIVKVGRWVELGIGDQLPKALALDLVTLIGTSSSLFLDLRKRSLGWTLPFFLASRSGVDDEPLLWRTALIASLVTTKTAPVVYSWYLMRSSWARSYFLWSFLTSFFSCSFYFLNSILSSTSGSEVSGDAINFL